MEPPEDECKHEMFEEEIIDVPIPLLYMLCKECGMEVLAPPTEDLRNFLKAQRAIREYTLGRRAFLLGHNLHRTQAITVACVLVGTFILGLVNWILGTIVLCLVLMVLWYSTREYSKMSKEIKEKLIEDFNLIFDPENSQNLADKIIARSLDDEEFSYKDQEPNRPPGEMVH